MDLRSAHAIVEPLELQADTWICGAEVPWLPDLVAADLVTTAGRSVLSEALGRQIAMLHAIAAAAPRNSAVQLRFITMGADSDLADRRTRIVILVRGATVLDAARLVRLISVTLPPEFPLTMIAPNDLAAVVTPFPMTHSSTEQIVEIRRAAESLDTFSAALEMRNGAPPTRPVVLPWSTTVHALSGSLMLLATSPEPSVLVVHIEPARPSADLIAYLDETVQDIAAISSLDQNPLAATALRTYRIALRELPRAALRMRVSLASRSSVPPGLAEGVAVDLTRAWETAGGTGVPCAFEVVRPHDTNDVDRAIGLFTRLRSAGWRDNVDSRLAEMIEMVDVVQAASAFRLPVSAQGGVPGVATTRLSTLPGSPELETSGRGAAIRVGTSPAGAPVTISLDELNQHVLVAGLPGFGKTTTTHQILRALWLEHRVPFLVVDPAKSDYETLLADLQARGADVALIDVTPERVAMNPFAVPANVMPAAHAQRVLAAFDAALRLSEAWAQGYIVLSRAIFEAYDRAAERKSTPTLRSVYAAIADIIKRGGYAGADGANMRASLLGRIEYFASGPLGSTLNGDAESGVDWPDLLSKPTVIQLRGIPGPQERSLVFGLLTAGLISYREANPAVIVGNSNRETSGLGHVTVLEEAHRLLPVEELRRSEGTRAMVEAIAELRSSGEGFFIVDQAPSRLAAGVTKLCGSMISHRLVEMEERTSVGSTMVLEESQLSDLARLSCGRALLYSPSRTAAVLCDVDAAPPQDGRHQLVQRRTLNPTATAENIFCVGCPDPCRHDETSLPIRRQLEQSFTGDVGVLAQASLSLARGNRGLAHCAAAGALGTSTVDNPRLLRRELFSLNAVLVHLTKPDGATQ